MSDDLDKSLRLSKMLASNTKLSRREASEAIRKGEVKVNGKIEKNPAFELSDKDVVTYKNEDLTEWVPTEFVLFNMSKTMLLNEKNEKNRPSVMDIVKKQVATPLTSVHGLPDEMCGLLLLTNDGEVIQKFDTKLPIVKQIYECTFETLLEKDQIAEISDSFNAISGLACKKIQTETKENQTVLTFECYGFGIEQAFEIFKNRDISLVKMDRTYLGGLTKKDIGRGWFRKLTEEEIIRFRHFFNPPQNKENESK